MGLFRRYAETLGRIPGTREQIQDGTQLPKGNTRINLFDDTQDACAAGCLAGANQLTSNKTTYWTRRLLYSSLKIEIGRTLTPDYAGISSVAYRSCCHDVRRLGRWDVDGRTVERCAKYGRGEK